MDTIMKNTETASYSKATYLDLDEAIRDAKEQSIAMNTTLYIIISSERYWVGTNSELSDWEKIYATYKNGVRV